LQKTKHPGQLGGPPDVSIDISSASSIVVIAAHPDDVKSCTGVLLRGMRIGATASVIWLTNGERFGDSDTYEKARTMAEGRKGNIFNFCARVGLARANAFLPGFPGGPAFAEMAQESSLVDGRPVFAELLRSEEVQDEDAYRKGTPFSGHALLELLEEILVAYQPTHVFAHHREDSHRTHRTAASFVAAAISSLVSGNRLKRRPDVLAFLVYSDRMQWPPLGDSFAVPQVMRESSLGAPLVVPLSAAEEHEKRVACMEAFGSTVGVDYISQNMKRDELFWCVCTSAAHPPGS